LTADTSPQKVPHVELLPAIPGLPEIVCDMKRAPPRHNPQPHISAAEYRSRIESLRTAAGEAGLDVFLVTSFDGIYYLTGAGYEPLERPFFLLIRPDRQPRLLVPKLDQEHLKKAYNIDPADVRSYWEYPAPAGRRWSDLLADELAGARNVGVEPTLKQEIFEALNGVSLSTVPLLDELRIVKSPAEVQMIRRAARYADLGVERLFAASYFGSTVAEGFAETRTITSRILSEVDNWEPLTSKVLMATWAAPGSAMPHSVPRLADRLRDGPHVALALTRVNGYAAESERTYFTAKPSPAARAVFEAMLEARRLMFEMIVPGAHCGEIDTRVGDFLRVEGLGNEDVRLHRAGHGIGMGNHEPPWLADGSEERLVERMVISVEPGIYIEGLGGFRHSDTVLVTGSGYELLTRLPTDLGSSVRLGWNPRGRLKGRMVRRALGLTRRPDRAPRPG
jgi:Xaa-Pro dipeptidase